jgi:hypothetical protein
MSNTKFTTLALSALLAATPASAQYVVDIGGGIYNITGDVPVQLAVLELSYDVTSTDLSQPYMFVTGNELTAITIAPGVFNDGNFLVTEHDFGYGYAANGAYTQVSSGAIYSVDAVVTVTPMAAPEIDASSAAAMITLLVGGLLVLRGLR